MICEEHFSLIVLFTVISFTGKSELDTGMSQSRGFIQIQQIQNHSVKNQKPVESTNTNFTFR